MVLICEHQYLSNRNNKSSTFDVNILHSVMLSNVQ